MIAITALYLAGKVEEEHVRLTDIINVSYRFVYSEAVVLVIQLVIYFCLVFFDKLILWDIKFQLYVDSLFIYI